MHHEYRFFLFDEFPYISQDSLEKIPPLKNIIAVSDAEVKDTDGKTTRVCRTVYLFTYRKEIGNNYL